MRRQTMLHLAGSDLTAARQIGELSTQKRRFNVSVGSLAPDPTLRAESGPPAVQHVHRGTRLKQTFILPEA